MQRSTLQGAPEAGRAAPDGGAAGPDEPRVGLVDRFLRFPLLLKIVLANAGIAIAAVSGALVLARLPSGATTGNGMAWAVAGFVLTVLAATTLLNAMVVRLALSPLEILEQTADLVRRGDLSARAPVSRLSDRPMRSLVVLFNRMLDTLQAGRKRQKELARRILEAEERERERIAHELYAGPAQTLAGVMIRLRLAARARGGATGADAFDEGLRDEVATALDEIRALARRLRPPELDELGVRAALEAHARTLTEGRDIRVTVRGSLHERGLHAQSATVLFRILQEAVTNAVRHSGGSHVEVTFRPEAGRLVAEVRDDGEGFDPLRHLRTPESGVGIAGMQERASYAGGTVTVASSEGGGTRVRVELPWKGAPYEGEAHGMHVAAELGFTEPEAEAPIPGAIT